MPFARLVLKNARVISMDAAQPPATLVAVSGDRISLVSTDNDLESVTSPGIKIIDCRGKTVVPGFNDAHCHIMSFIRRLLSLDLGPDNVRSIQDIKELIRVKAAQTPAGRWISGNGYDDFHLAEKRHPTRWDIDEAAPDNPVVIAHRSLHACVLNSMALSLAGITAETPEPPGSMIERDLKTGEPTGLLYEMLGYVRQKVTPGLSSGELEQSLTQANNHYLSIGITSLQDATVTNDLKRWQTYRSFKENDKLRSRLTIMCGPDTRLTFQEAGMSYGYGDESLRLGSMKILPNETKGELFPPQPELNKMVLEANRAGFPCAIHSVPASMVEAVIKALEYTKSKMPDSRIRNRIEHCSECPPELLERLRRLKPVIVSQPPFLYFNGERYLAQTPHEMLPYLYPYRSWFEAGLIAAGSSDHPIVSNNPLLGIWAAVTRQARSGPPVNTAECVSVQQALQMYTMNAAYASGDEARKGSIVPGKLADMVILSDNPFRVPSGEIKDIKVETTVLGGEVVWNGGGLGES